MHAQDDAAATHAAKLEKADGQLDFRKDARVLHNKVSLLCSHCSSMVCVCHASGAREC